MPLTHFEKRGEAASLEGPVTMETLEILLHSEIRPGFSSRLIGL